MKIGIFIVAFVAILALTVIVFMKVAPQLGNKGIKDIPQRIEASPQFRNGKFHNLLETDVSFEGSSFFTMIKEMYTHTLGRVPEKPIGNIPMDDNWWQPTQGETSVTWLGHSTILIRTKDAVILTDPVFSPRASLVNFMGPKKFEYAFPYTLEQVKNVDAIILSHDHYDHMDYKALKYLMDKTKMFYVPLGVKAHLVKWGVDESKVEELDWWEETSFENSLRLACTPSRHFSGRRLNNRFSTLWCSWVIKTKDETLFFGGDSGYHTMYPEIAKRYGPFDMAMLECGAYSKYWPDIHSFPEQTATAFRELNADVLLPIHWAKFNLSIHNWKEPIERLMKEAEIFNLNVATPRIGEKMTIGAPMPTELWWE